MSLKKIKALLDKRKEGLLSQEEEGLLNTWYLEMSKSDMQVPKETLITKNLSTIWSELEVNQQLKRKLYRLRLIRISTAAILFIVLGSGVYFYKFSSPASIVTDSKDISAGGNKAFLTLANGNRITLTDARRGELAKEVNVQINKEADGLITYQSTGHAVQKSSYNTVETPNGGTFQVMLPDGTKVWLNAASSIRFPTSFSGQSHRKVELLTGEAYFEVSKDKKHPFHVKVGRQDVEVLGTHFNINSYEEEKNIKTTLLEGSVKINQHTVLTPGEQAINTGDVIQVKNIDVKTAVDWKNNDFILDGESFKSIMRKIARWYNVQIVYDASAPEDIELGGWVSRKSNISVILKRIESTGKVHFKIEERRITVSR